MAQEDDLRALGKIMDFLRAVSIILAIMNVYWYCYEAMHMWGVTIGVVDRILINFNRTGGLFHSILYTKLFSLLLLALSCLGTKGVKAEKMSWNRIWTVLVVGFCLVLPQLVDIIVAYISFGQCHAVHIYNDSGLYLPVDGRTLDEQTLETQPHGGCVQ